MSLKRPVMANFGPSGFMPLFVSLFLAALMLLPIGTGVSNVAMPHFAMMCVFYWSCTRPLLMPYGAAALIGFMLDLWLDVPLGLNILILVLVRLFVMNQIKYFKGRSIVIYWAVFSVMSAGLFALMWVITSFSRGYLIPMEPVFLQLALTVVGYGVVGLILGRIRRSLLR